jgi:signal transduction histidine kinase
LEAALDELRQMRMQLVQQDKLNAIGTLAAGLLHEINNPLNHANMALTYGLDLVRDGDTTSGDPSSSTVSVPREDLTETLDDITVALNRVSAIVSDLRSFAYPDAKKSAQSFSVRRALDTAFRFTRAESEGLRFEVEADDDLTAWGVETQVVQIVVNLVLNATAAARERHPGGGGRVRVAARRHDDRAELVVWDNGPGIEPSIRDRIFEPFFTTKDVGRGLGLGLSICHSLVAAQGGELSVESEPGQWSEFRVRLPLTETDAAPSEEHAHVGATHTDLR